MSRPSYVLTTTLPHPDHFDPSKFGPDGERIGCKDRPNAGRPSKLRPDDAEQLVLLDQLFQATAKDLIDFMVDKGITTKNAQLYVLSRLRNGWRPVK